MTVWHTDCCSRLNGSVDDFWEDLRPSGGQNDHGVLHQFARASQEILALDMGHPSVNTAFIESEVLLHDRRHLFAERAYSGRSFELRVLERFSCRESGPDSEPSAAILAVRVGHHLGLHQVTVMK